MSKYLSHRVIRKPKKWLDKEGQADLLNRQPKQVWDWSKPVEGVKLVRKEPGLQVVQTEHPTLATPNRILELRFELDETLEIGTVGRLVWHHYEYFYGWKFVTDGRS